MIEYDKRRCLIYILCDNISNICKQTIKHENRLHPQAQYSNQTPSHTPPTVLHSDKT